MRGIIAVIVGGLEESRQHNGQFGVVIGTDTTPPFRRHVRLDRTGVRLKVRPENLHEYANANVLLNAFHAHELILETLKSFSTELLHSDRRRDAVGRARLMAEFVAHPIASPVLIACCDMDAAVARSGRAHTQMTRVLEAAAAGVQCKGDGRVSILRFAQGLGD
ncbi:hypothetical protein PINS_up021065 [Pythium insidiosum]|nr:hypothetical protein PINS_up021065 [Pythium insidiosum]